MYRSGTQQSATVGSVKVTHEVRTFIGGRTRIEISMDSPQLQPDAVVMEMFDMLRPLRDDMDSDFSFEYSYDYSFDNDFDYDYDDYDDLDDDDDDDDMSHD